jgi:hypothetical protein
MLSLFSILRKRPLPVKGVFWIKELPLELLIKVMSSLLREDLESLISVLHIDFTGVVQYIEDTPSIWSRHYKLRNISLKDLDHKRNKSMMNIVIIKNPGILDVERMARRLSGSTNLFVLSNVKVDMTVQFVFLPNILEKLLHPNSCRRSGPFQISDSDKLRVRFRDVSQAHFNNINELLLVRCKVGGGSQQFTISNVKVLHLVACSRKIIQYHASEYGNRDDIPTADFLLRGLYINCPQLIISDCDVKNSVLKGTSLTLFSDPGEQKPLTISKVRAPKLCDLKIEFYNLPPVVTDFYVPKLKNVEILKYHMNWFPQPASSNSAQTGIENYQYLHGVEGLKLRFFWEPLYEVEFKSLFTLTLYMHKNLGPLKNEFPTLERLYIFLMEDADQVPEIKAKNLIKLTISSSRNLGIWTRDQARRRYPQLISFSYSWSPRVNLL